MVRLHDIMSVEVTSVAPNMTLREAADILTSEHISGAPVLSGNTVVGVVSASDLVDFVSSNPGPPVQRTETLEEREWRQAEAWDEGEEPAASYFEDLWANAGAEVLERFRETDRPEWNTLEEHVVAEVMTPKACMLPPNTEIGEAAGYMLRRGIHRVLITEDSRLLGVATTTDFVKAVAQHGLGG